MMRMVLDVSWLSRLGLTDSDILRILETAFFNAFLVTIHDDRLCAAPPDTTELSDRLTTQLLQTIPNGVKSVFKFIDPNVKIVENFLLIDFKTTPVEQPC